MSRGGHDRPYVRAACACGSSLEGNGISFDQLTAFNREHAACSEAWRRVQQVDVPLSDRDQPVAAPDGTSAWATFKGEPICGKAWRSVDFNMNVLVCSFPPGHSSSHSWESPIPDDPWPDRCPEFMQGSRCRAYADGRGPRRTQHIHWTNDTDKPPGFTAPWEHERGCELDADHSGPCYPSAEIRRREGS